MFLKLKKLIELADDLLGRILFWILNLKFSRIAMSIWGIWNKDEVEWEVGYIIKILFIY